MEHPYWSLGYLAESRHTLWASCNHCTHFFDLDWDQVLARFDASLLATEAKYPIQNALVCPRCGCLDMEVRIAVPKASLGGHGFSGVW